MRIVITTGDDEPPEDYVATVLAQLDAGYTSGHVDPTHHWTIEKD